MEDGGRARKAGGGRKERSKASRCVLSDYAYIHPPNTRHHSREESSERVVGGHSLDSCDPHDRWRCREVQRLAVSEERWREDRLFR